MQIGILENLSEVLIYLDNYATTPLDPRVLEGMMPFFKHEFGNASSTNHFGLSIKAIVEESREKVANLIGASSSDIVFTSGATESINIALKGFAIANAHKGKHLITCVSEHKAILETCKYLETIGFDVTYLPVNNKGLIELEGLEKAIRPDTILVTIMYVNNEIGVIQPIQEIGNLTKKKGVIFMCDASQAVGKISINVNDLGIDILTFSGHKYYGPKGIGCLFVKSLKRKDIKIAQTVHGGGHENGFRSGTLNVPAIVGLGISSEIANKEMKQNAQRILLMRDKLENELLKIPQAFVNGSTERRIYNVTNICFPGVDASIVIGRLKNIALSNGSACTSAVIEPSHVLKSIGLSYDDSLASLRFSLGKFNTMSEVMLTAQILQPLLNTSTSQYA